MSALSEEEEEEEEEEGGLLTPDIQGTSHIHVPEFSLQVPSLSLSLLLPLSPSLSLLLPLPLPFQHRYNRKLDYLQHKENKYPSPHFSTSLPHYKTSICKQHWLP